MTDGLLSSVAAARWALPIRTPQDSSTQARHESESNSAGYALLRDTPLERVRGEDQSTGETGHNLNGAGVDDEPSSIDPMNSGRDTIARAEQAGRAMVLGSI